MTFTIASGAVFPNFVALLAHLQMCVEPPLPCTLVHGARWQDAVILQGSRGRIPDPLLADLQPVPDTTLYAVTVLPVYDLASASLTVRTCPVETSC